MPAEEVLQDVTQLQEEGKRERSKIQFPYLTLDDAVGIAKGVHTVGGSSCQLDQLAAHLQQKVDSSMFRLKLGAAKMFGLVTYAQGTVSLTPLGSRVSDPQQEASARAEAFLTIPLYKQIYEQFKGGSLPPTAGLEAAIATLGVAPKQKDNARQVFQRSAQQAGFFAYGPNRLVYPSTKGGAEFKLPKDIDKSGEDSGNNRNNGGTGGDGGDGSSQHPLIEGLIKTLKGLPSPENAQWPIEARKKWLQTAANIFDLVYSGEDGISLIIEIKKDSAK